MKHTGNTSVSHKVCHFDRQPSMKSIKSNTLYIQIHQFCDKNYTATKTIGTRYIFMKKSQKMFEFNRRAFNREGNSQKQQNTPLRRSRS